MSLQTVEEAVTCVKCKGLPLSNVYSCDAGHVLCEECNGSTCPKEDCGSEVIFQNQAIQNVINRVFTDYPCSYSYGSTVCLKKGPPVDIRHHQASCLLRYESHRQSTVIFTDNFMTCFECHLFLCLGQPLVYAATTFNHSTDTISTCGPCIPKLLLRAEGSQTTQGSGSTNSAPFVVKSSFC